MNTKHPKIHTLAKAIKKEHPVSYFMYIARGYAHKRKYAILNITLASLCVLLVIAQTITIYKAITLNNNLHALNSDAERLVIQTERLQTQILEIIREDTRERQLFNTLKGICSDGF